MKPLVAHASLLAVLVLVALAILVVGRTVSRASAELRAADAHRQEGEMALAIEHYRRTLRWSFPFSPYTPAAIAGLESIAGDLESAGDRPGALLAWRSLAGGLAASRSSYAKTSDARDMAKDQIARLLSVHSDAAIDSNLSADKLEADHRRLLDEEASPDPLWSAFLLLGFAVWIGALALIIRQGFDSTGRPAWAGARRPLWGALLGFGAFALGLLLA